MLQSSEIRARARASLKGKWWRAVWQYFVFALIYTIPLVLIQQWSQLASEAFSLLVAGAVALGAAAYFLAIVRGDKPAFSTLFSGFQHYAKTLLLYLIMLVFIFLWFLLLIVPGIIAGLRYSQAYYILLDNPEISPMEAIRRSKAMMAGHKGRLFVLGLSFIGWIILAAIPFGIGMLWLIPYMMAAYAHFYDDLRSRSLGLPPTIPENPAVVG